MVLGKGMIGFFFKSCHHQEDVQAKDLGVGRLMEKMTHKDS
jgi:hypothetical protein